MAQFDVYKVEVHHRIGSMPSMNVLHLIEVVGEDEENTPALSVAEVVADSYVTLAERLSSQWRVIAIRAVRIIPEPSIPYWVYFAGAETPVGEIISPVVPPQTSLLLTFYSQQHGPTGKGRIYLPGCPGDYHTDGQLTNVHYPLLASLCHAAFEGEKIPATAVTGRWRYYIQGDQAGTTPLRHVNWVTLRPNLATQKRRRALPAIAQ